MYESLKTFLYNRSMNAPNKSNLIVYSTTLAMGSLNSVCTSSIPYSMSMIGA